MAALGLGDDRLARLIERKQAMQVLVDAKLAH